MKQLVLAVLGLLVSRADATDITTCGATIAAGDTGVLQADLDCSASSVGVRLLRGATLDLNGHTIAGGDTTTATVAGVRALSSSNPVGSGRGDFTIIGPGVIAGTAHPPLTQIGTDACVLVNDGRARITSVIGPVEIRGCIYGVHGARRYKSNGELTTRGPNGRARVEMDHVSVINHAESGVAVSRLVATNITAVGNRNIALGATRRMTVTDVTANDNNGIGIFGGRLLEGVNVTTVGNSFNGVDTCGFGRIELANLVATNNGVYGVCGDRVQLTDSTAIDNDSVDIFSRFAEPLLVNTTCGTSAGGASGSSWGVCAND